MTAVFYNLLRPILPTLCVRPYLQSSTSSTSSPSSPSASPRLRVKLCL